MSAGIRRRDLLGLAGASTAVASLGLLGCAMGRNARPEPARVVVVGGGFGGATAAKYVRLLSQYRIEVVLIEPEAAFVSCPMSNLVLSGNQAMADITRPYETLSSMHGVQVVRDRVQSIDSAQRVVTLASTTTLRYDKLVLAPGIEMIWDDVPGLREANLQGRILQAWKAGSETAQLRRQIEALPDGAVFAIAIPEMPYRCPPAPYERASLVANYFKATKPRSKVLILDANEDVTSEGSLFKRAWTQRYAGLLEYRPQHKVTGVDAATNTLKFEIQEDVQADLINVLPPMRAGSIAVSAGLANSNARWCNVNFPDFESTAARNIHVIGDAIQIAPAMPKSGHMANSHAKVVAAALVAKLSGWELDPSPMLTSACYSFVDEARAMHVCSVHQYVAAEKTFRSVQGSGGNSSAANEVEASLAYSWAHSIWADALA